MVKPWPWPPAGTIASSSTRTPIPPSQWLKLRPNVLIASISHGENVEIPHGTSVIQEGDGVVVVTTERGTIDTLNDIFA